MHKLIVYKDLLSQGKVKFSLTTTLSCERRKTKDIVLHCWGLTSQDNKQ